MTLKQVGAGFLLSGGLTMLGSGLFDLRRVFR
jgi:hypothetical protein